jgi:hypothetical protein
MQTETTMSSDIDVTILPDFRDLLPKHSKFELELLEQSCVADPNHERMQPVILWRDNNNTVIDGHNQEEIRKRNGLQIRYAFVNFGSHEEAVQYALKVQMARRNIDKSQRAVTYAKHDRHTHGGDRKSKDQGAKLSVEKLAKAAGVSMRTMKSATKVVDNGAKNVIEGVRDGAFAVFDAAAIVKLDKTKQSEIVAEAKESGVTLRKAAKLLGFTKKRSRKSSKTKSSVLTGDDKKHALDLLKELSSAMKRFRLFSKHNRSLSAITRAVKAWKVPKAKKAK